MDAGADVHLGLRAIGPDRADNVRLTLTQRD